MEKASARLCHSLSRIALIVSGAAVGFAATPAFAQAAEETGNSAMGDIIVTAQKRAENVQDVPIAITAISGDALRARNVTEVQSLVQNVPGVVFSASNGEARISIRGVAYDGLAGGSAESRAAFHLDGVYLATTGEVYGTFYDVDRIEALRGPQGTLFGRNAIAGSINVITRDPTNTAEGYLQADLGNYDRVLLQGAVSGPLAEGISARVAFRMENRDGYDRNITNDVDVNNVKTRAIRGKLKLEPSSDLTIILAGDYFRQDDRQGFIFLGVYDPDTDPLTTGEKLGGVARDGNPRHDFSDKVSKTFREYWGLSATANLSLSDTLDVVSITSYRKQYERFDIDIDGTSAPLLNGVIPDRIKQFSQELRLQGTFDRGNFIVGGYYFYRNFNTQQQYPLDGKLIGFPDYTGFLDGIQLGGTARSKAFAVFAEGNYDLTDWLTITAGARYSTEKKSKIDEYNQFDVSTPYNPANPLPITVPVQNETNTYNNFSPRLTLTAKLNEDTSVYATFTKGFRSGGVNLGYNTPGFRPETLTDYEMGFKTELLDRRLRLNAAAFYYDYKDLQVSRAEFAGNSIQNAAAAKLYGAELEMIAVPVDGLRLDASAALIKSKFTEFSTFDPSRPQLGELDLTGNRLPQSPKYTLSYGAQYTTTTNAGEFILRGEGRSLSSLFFDQFNRRQNGERAFTILNAILSWKSSDERLYGSAFVRNIGNVLAKNGSLVFGGITGYNIEGSYDPPRTYGISLGVNF